MKERNPRKLSVTLYLVVFLAVIAMLIGTYYAYHVKTIREKDKTNVTVKNLDMLLMFNNGNQVNGKNLKPGWEESVEFSLENFSEDTMGKYKIVIEIITPLSNISDENFVYTITGESESKDTSNKVININETPVPVVTKDLTNAVITPKNTHSYKVTFRLKDSAKGKNYSNSLFAARIRIANDNN